MYKINYKDRIFNDSATVTGLRVQIQDGQTIITRILSGNHDHKTDEDLIELVLEQFYQETYPNRAENERFAKMDELFKEANKTLETTRQTLAQSVVKDFEYDALFKDISYKFEFLATHLKVELPTANDDDEEEKNEKDEKESNGDTPKA
ncbi:DUF1366 domain-containing protein [Gemella morbillorum]|uniref:DUF1366 domain-containing protein n=1 Tax=Gemella morbillorum TaxID=29391 RepID=UPI0028D4A9F0|nr:DUF1366 domain-containing protein [Gemella morbillorum]